MAAGGEGAHLPLPAGSEGAGRRRNACFRRPTRVAWLVGAIVAAGLRVQIVRRMVRELQIRRPVKEEAPSLTGGRLFVGSISIRARRQSAGGRTRAASHEAARPPQTYTHSGPCIHTAATVNYTVYTLGGAQRQPSQCGAHFAASPWTGAPLPAGQRDQRASEQERETGGSLATKRNPIEQFWLVFISWPAAGGHSF